MGYKVTVTCVSCGYSEVVQLGDPRDEVYLSDILEVDGWEYDEPSGYFICPNCVGESD